MVGKSFSSKTLLAITRSALSMTRDSQLMFRPGWTLLPTVSDGLVRSERVELLPVNLLDHFWGRAFPDRVIWLLLTNRHPLREFIIFLFVPYSRSKNFEPTLTPMNH